MKVRTCLHLTISQTNFLIRERLWEDNGPYVEGTKLRGWVERELRLCMTDILPGPLPQPCEAYLVSPELRQRTPK